MRVETVTLDNQLQGNSIEDVDFLKIDTQGSELSILQGAKETLSKRNLLKSHWVVSHRSWRIVDSAAVGHVLIARTGRSAWHFLPEPRVLNGS